jgi:predicted RNA-binding protein YlxR (DUF448 family)
MPDPAQEESGPLRTCVVTRAERAPDQMIRFVLGPDGMVAPDLRRRLPGRGVWTNATAATVAEAVKRRAFERGFKAAAKVPDGLVALIDRLMEADCLQALSLANKAGAVVAGFAKIEAEIEAGQIAAVFHAADGGADGKRKIGQALRRRFGPETPAEMETFDSSQLGLALGRTNVIHAALRSGAASAALVARCRRLQIYRAGDPDLTAGVSTAPDGTNGPVPRTQDE